MSSPGRTIAKIVVGVVLTVLTFGIATLALLAPVTADVVVPLHPGYRWVGVELPTVSVSCGTLRHAETPKFPAGTKYVTAAHVRAAESDCAAARSKQRTLAIAFGSAGVLLVALFGYGTRRQRRADREASAQITPV